MDESLEGCDVCGNNHTTEECPILAFDDLGSQENVLSRARLTLPWSLDLVDEPDGTVRVIAKQRLQPKQRLGPFEARRTTQKIDIENGFILKVFAKDSATVWLDTSDENNCNWLCLVRTATCTKSQNMMAVQLGTEIFYVVTKAIEPGTELLVWYAPHYARKVGKMTEPDGKTRALIGQMLVSVDNTVIAIGADITPTKLYNICRQGTAEKELEPLGLSWQTIQTLLSQAETQQTSEETTPPSSWTVLSRPMVPRIAHIKHMPNELGVRTCRHCSAQFDTLEGMACHVREHLRANVLGRPMRNSHAGQSGQPKRKRGRPRKYRPEQNRLQLSKQQEEQSATKEDEQAANTAIVIRAPYVASATGDNTNLEQRSKEDVRQLPVEKESFLKTTPPDANAIKIIDVTNTKLPEGDEHVLNIRGEGYSIIVRDAEDNQPEAVDVEAGATSALITEHVHTSNIEETALEEDGEESEVMEDDDIADPSFVPNKPHAFSTGRGLRRKRVVSSDQEEEGASDWEVEPSTSKRGQRAPPRQPSRRGRRGELTKNCTLTLDDNKRLIYRCNHCSQSFIKLELFSRHMREQHQHLASICSRCQTAFNSAEELSQHTCVGAGADELTATAAPTAEAAENIHNDRESEAIVSAAPDADSLPSDVEVVNMEKEEGDAEPDKTTSASGNKIYRCRICAKSFEKVKYLKRHIEGHSDLFNCRKCEKRFARKETLLQHVCTTVKKGDGAKLMEDPLIYHCEFCGVSFAKQHYLLRHMATHTGEFKCKNCDRLFSRKESLLQHIKKYHFEALSDSDSKAYPCDKCHRVFSREVSLKNHKKFHEGAHRCERCGRCFASVFNLEKHLCGDIVAHEKGFQCKECEKVFPTPAAVKQHLLIHSDNLTCTLCGANFLTRSALIKHYVTCSAAVQAGESGTFLCTVCNVTYPDAGSFQAHFKQHTHPYRCDKCDKLFIRISNLRRHKCVPVELGVDTVSCEVCGRKFSHERFLQRHMSVHNPPKYECETCHGKFTRIDFFNNHMCISEDGKLVQVHRNLKKEDLLTQTSAICPTCGKSYASISNLNKHMKTHGEKTETCDVCGKRFHLKIALREHMQSVHTEEYRHQCQYCGKFMKCRNSLFGHVRQFHSETIVMYVCDQCGKQFRQKGNLKKHVLTHSTQKTFACKECNKLFKFPDQLKRHEIWHLHGERFICEFCSKKFVMQFELRKHRQLYHSGVIYMCKYCRTECRHAHTMKRHLQNRHADHAEWQAAPSEFIRSLVTQRRLADAVDEVVQTAMVADGPTSEEVAESSEGRVVVVQEAGILGQEAQVVITHPGDEDGGTGDAETAGTVVVTGTEEQLHESSLLDNALLAAQLQTQIHDPSLSVDGQPFIVAEVSRLGGTGGEVGEAGGDLTASTQTVIIQTSGGQHFDMSQEVAAALQSLSKHGTLDENTLTIIQNPAIGDQGELQATDQAAVAAAGGQPFIILPMVTETTTHTTVTNSSELDIAAYEASTITDEMTTATEVL